MASDDQLKAGELPKLASLLGGQDGSFAHAHFEDSVLSTLPSSTIPAWVTIFTGVPPAQHGVVGNEFFLRESADFVAPVPVTFSDPSPVLENFNDSYLNGFVKVPSVYERMRKQDKYLQVWVAMLHYHAGTDQLLLTDRGVLADAFKAFVEEQVKERLTSKESRAAYETLDEEVIESVVEELEDDDAARPDVLTIYLSGADQYAHVAKEGPDEARRTYLKEALEPEFEKLEKALKEADMLDDAYVVVVSDHGHTEVVHDEQHALGMEDNDGDPPTVIKRAGFRLRPFEWKVEGRDYQAVLAYQGAMAFVYLADRSSCSKADQDCDWKRPPRYREDVLELAEAFYENDRSGRLAKGMKGALDMILVRETKSYEKESPPFSVYVGKQRVVSVEEYLAAHPHPSYVALANRMRDLAVGPHGHRAGDLVLIAHNGDRDDPKQRYYFASTYHSWHGSPSRRDSEIALIVAHGKHPRAKIQSLVRGALPAQPRQQHVADVLFSLRYGAPEKQKPHR